MGINSDKQDFFVLLDDAVAPHARLLTHFQSVDLLCAAHLDEVDSKLRVGWQRGWHAFLWLDYELGLPLQRIAQHDVAGYLKIFWFSNREDIDNVEHWLAEYANGLSDLPTGIVDLSWEVREEDYLNTVMNIQTAIARGDIYQMNYTNRLNFGCYGSPFRLYSRLRYRQPVSYGVLAYLPHNELPEWTLCFSPELFLKIEEKGVISSQPMKGTAPIKGDDHDQWRAVMLSKDIKNRAENIMIVDLLRNDLGKIAHVGGVTVPKVFEVTAHGQVWQMTSTVSAVVQPDTSFADIVRATFPCGSITGAPKRMSMNFIHQLESSCRGIYTGSLGWIEPVDTGMGFSAVLNVAIRTIQLRASHEKDYFSGSMGIGSGIVWDSDARLEYEECGWKGQFLIGLQPEIDLIETMRIDHGQCALYDLHFHRCLSSALRLGFSIDAQKLQHQWDDIFASISQVGVFGLRLRLTPAGQLSYQLLPLEEPRERYRVLSRTTIPIQARWLSRFKTTYRQDYHLVMQEVELFHAFDALLYDEQGRLLEGSRSNVFIKLHGRWYTPPSSLPILNGVMRQAVMNHPQKYLQADGVDERMLTLRDVHDAEELVLTNALRGVMRHVEIVDSNTHISS